MSGKSKKHSPKNIPGKTGSKSIDTTTDVVREEKEDSTTETMERDQADNFNRQKDRREDASVL